MGILKDIWNKNKDGNKKEQRSFIRVAIIATTLAVVFLFVKRDNVINWVQAGFTIAHQNKEIKANELKIQKQDDKLESLKTNRDSLEKFARETFHFAEKGEDIYLIPEK